VPRDLDKKSEYDRRRYGANREQIKARAGQWHRDNYTLMIGRRHSLWRKYRLRLDDYEDMVDAQSGLCLVCGKPESQIDSRTGHPYALAVDHCHDTGVIRGLLCAQCNRGIGNFKNDPASLRSAAAYLEGVKGPTGLPQQEEA